MHRNKVTVSSVIMRSPRNPGPVIEEDIELIIPPPPQLGNRVVELSNVGVTSVIGTLSLDFSFTLKTGCDQEVAVRTASAKPLCSR